jgi:hypothetical protein
MSNRKRKAKEVRSKVRFVAGQGTLTVKTGVKAGRKAPDLREFDLTRI